MINVRLFRDEIGAMAINVYRLQPCLRGKNSRRLIFYCSLCYILWTHLTQLASYFHPITKQHLAQSHNAHLFPTNHETAPTKKLTLEEIRQSIHAETRNENFNYSGLIIAVQGLGHKQSCLVTFLAKVFWICFLQNR